MGMITIEPTRLDELAELAAFHGRISMKREEVLVLVRMARCALEFERRALACGADPSEDAVAFILDARKL